MAKIIHLYLKATDEHKYYGSLQALYDDGNDVGISKFTLDRYDFSKPYENLTCIIRKGEIFTAGEARAKVAKEKKLRKKKG